MLLFRQTVVTGVCVVRIQSNSVDRSSARLADSLQRAVTSLSIAVIGGVLRLRLAERTIAFVRARFAVVAALRTRHSVIRSFADASVFACDNGARWQRSLRVEMFHGDDEWSYGYYRRLWALQFDVFNELRLGSVFLFFRNGVARGSGAIRTPLGEGLLCGSQDAADARRTGAVLSVRISAGRFVRAIPALIRFALGFALADVAVLVSHNVLGALEHLVLAESQGQFHKHFLVGRREVVERHAISVDDHFQHIVHTLYALVFLIK